MRGAKLGIPDLLTNGGIGAMILNPAKTKVCLIFEYGWWKPVTGTVGREVKMSNYAPRTRRFIAQLRGVSSISDTLQKSP